MPSGRRPARKLSRSRCLGSVWQDYGRIEFPILVIALHRRDDDCHQERQRADDGGLVVGLRSGRLAVRLPLTLGAIGIWEGAFVDVLGYLQVPGKLALAR